MAYKLQLPSGTSIACDTLEELQNLIHLVDSSAMAIQQYAVPQPAAPPSPVRQLNTSSQLRNALLNNPTPMGAKVI